MVYTVCPTNQDRWTDRRYQTCYLPYFVFDNEKTCDLCEKLLIILYLHSPKLPVRTEFSSFRKWTLYLFREISTDSSWFILWPLSLAYHYISHGLHCFFMQGLNLSWTFQCVRKLVAQVSLLMILLLVVGSTAVMLDIVCTKLLQALDQLIKEICCMSMQDKMNNISNSSLNLIYWCPDDM